MGHFRIRTLLDMAIADLNVKAECRWCGRWRVIESARLMWTFHKKGWPIEVEHIADRLRCAGCGRKDLFVMQTDAAPTPVQPARYARRDLKLIESAVPPCPDGIDPTEWLTASERERKRMIGRLR
jgi:hypothetical protein